MNTRVALVTDKGLHHKFWVAEMSKHNNVVCILHPNKKDAASRKKKKLKAMYQGKGLWYTLLYLVTEFYLRLTSSNSRKEFKKESLHYFREKSKAYDQIDQSIIYDIETVNAQESMDIIQRHNVDVVCFLGGDIARAEFIQSPKKVCLNFHSGLSPVYNGAGSYLWAMTDQRPNLVGGTLMKMNARIDGGDILAHYLPEITKEDNASSLFMKTIIGSTELYTQAIAKIEQDEPMPFVKQERSLRYTKVIDWTLYQELQLKAFYKSGRIEKYTRTSAKIWVDKEGNDALFVSQMLKNTLKSSRK